MTDFNTLLTIVRYENGNTEKHAGRLFELVHKFSDLLIEGTELQYFEDNYEVGTDLSTPEKLIDSLNVCLGNIENAKHARGVTLGCVYFSTC